MSLIDLMYYDLKAAALIAVFYLFYRLLLARETMHSLNRAVLLAAIGLSLVLPLCVVTLHQTVILDVPQLVIEDNIQGDSNPTPIFNGTEGDNNWSAFFAILLATGILIRLAILARSYWKLHRLIANGEYHTLNTGTQVCVVEEPVAPFSWMHTVVLSREEWLSPSASILVHEEAHVRHHHSYDVMVVEILTALQWFNPVVWFLRQELRTLHEYEADASVLSSGFDESQYIHLLMQKATGIQACALANGINTHRTKKRIIMMLKPKSKRRAWLKALYILPIVLGSLALSAKTVVDYQTTMTGTIQEPLLRVFHDNTKGECYQIRHMPGVKFYLNGKQEEIPGNRPIALEASKTTLQSNGVDIDKLSLSQIPVGMLKEIHLNEVDTDHFVANFITEEKGKTILIVDGEVVSQEVVNNIHNEDITNIDVIKNKDFCRKYGKDIENVVIIRTKQSDDPVFEICEQSPSFPGGDAKLMEFIAKNIKYPEIAKEYGVQGRVLVQFIVEKDGSLTHLKAIEGPPASKVNFIEVTATMTEQEQQNANSHNNGVQALRDEAFRVIKAMPKWTPGKQQGKTVRCKFIIPVTYRLN